jgi:uncharacterized membrane protein YhaH (DUF805 family)
MKRIVVLVVCVILVTGCGAVSAGGEYSVGRGETVRGDLWLMGGNSRLGEDSRVTGSVIMMGGEFDVFADAEIEGDLIMFGGEVSLGRGVVVRGDVIKAGGNVRRAEGARIEGKISSDPFDIGAGFAGAFCLAPVVLFVVLLFWLISLTQRRRVAEPGDSRVFTLAVGGVLILIGAFLFARNLFDFDLGNWWALLILIPAVGSLADVWRIYRAEGRLSAAARGPLVAGLALLLVTVIFLFGLSWGTLWPLFVIIVGAGVLVAR